jgi:hypothetical protein
LCPNGGNVGIGTPEPWYKLQVIGDIFALGGWVRVQGDAGFYFETHGGGWNMSDTDYIRAYGGKAVYSSNFFYSDSGYKVGANVVIDSSRNIAAGELRTTGSIILGGQGSYEPGVIYTDSNWGMLFRAKQAAPAMAEFSWRKSDGSQLMDLRTNKLYLPAHNIESYSLSAGAHCSGTLGYVLGNYPVASSGFFYFNPVTNGFSATNTRFTLTRVAS